jgi:hypothetical protein
MTAETWERHFLWPWQQVKLLDGSEVKGEEVMRRKVNGALQYRKPTATDDAADEQAWWDRQY